MPLNLKAIPFQNNDDIARVLEADADELTSQWLDALEQLHPEFRSLHREELKDSLPRYLRAVAQALRAPDRSPSDFPQLFAFEHGDHRWKSGWDLKELVDDYLLLRLLALQHFETRLDRRLAAPEAMAFSLYIDETLKAAVAAFADFEMAALQSLNETLEQRVQERTALAEEQSRQVQQLAIDLTRAEHQERRRLSRLLHDHLQQLLVAAQLRLGRMEKRETDPRITPAIAELQDLLRQALEESRNLTARLSPLVLDSEGLAAALRWLAVWMNETFHFHLRTDLASNAEPTLPETSVVLFEAARELTFNAVKHSGTTSADLRLALCEPDQIALTLEDRGRGMAPDQLRRIFESGGTGLAHARNRLALLGGRIEITSQPGAGSRFVLLAPRGGPPV